MYHDKKSKMYCYCINFFKGKEGESHPAPSQGGGVFDLHPEQSHSIRNTKSKGVIQEIQDVSEEQN